MESSKFTSPNWDRIAGVLLLLFVIAFVFAHTDRALLVFAPGLFENIETIGYSLLTKSLAFVFSVFSSIVSIGCGVWLYIEAKKENRSKYVWILLGVFGGGVIAVVLWFLIKAYRSIEELKQQTHNQSLNSTPKDGEN